MKNMKLALVATMFCAVAAPALADEVTVGNNYARLSGGVIMPEDIDVTVPGATGTFSFDDGLIISGAVGFWMNDNLTLEGEVSYLDADFDKLTVLGTTSDVDGSFSSTLAMANASYHFGGKNAAFDPYLGAGAGAAFSKLDISSVGGLAVNGEDTSTDLALQGTAGVNMRLSGGISLGAQYRYLYTDTGGDGSDDFTAHNFMATATFAF